jgi:hypothetical protein
MLRDGPTGPGFSKKSPPAYQILQKSPQRFWEKKKTKAPKNFEKHKYMWTCHVSIFLGYVSLIVIGNEYWRILLYC